ncbi:MAG TPA: carbohydrate kinase [Natronosporangium sp.]|nr:carbohydrate kinase [Natronosporangium sp.]
MEVGSYLVVGEALVDLISEPGSWRFQAVCGGSPLNVAVALAAAGHPVRLASQAGDDLFGQLLRDHLTRYGVDTRDVIDTGDATNLAFAHLDAAGAAHYDFRLSWTWPGPVDLTGVDWLHTGSLAAVLDPGAAAVTQAVHTARRAGIPVSYDPNVRPVLMRDPATARPVVERWVAAADLVKVSAEDLAWLYPGVPDLAVAADWAERGPALVVVTRGAAGAVARYRGGVVECAAPRVRVVDTIGAGDLFTAGLLSRLADWRPEQPLERPRLVAALRYATALAAAGCARRGAVPPPAADVAALLGEEALRGR